MFLLGLIVIENGECFVCCLLRGKCAVVVELIILNNLEVDLFVNVVFKVVWIFIILKYYVIVNKVGMMEVNLNFF